MSERIRDWGLIPGRMETGKTNTIMDVPGVKVGHFTVNDQKHHTGVTVILPREDIFYHRCTAACEIINGFGKTAGLGQIDELGQLETPIVLTNTLNVGLMYDAVVEYTSKVCREHGEILKSVNPVVGECNDGSLNFIKERILGFDEFMKAAEDAEANYQAMIQQNNPAEINYQAMIQQNNSSAVKSQETPAPGESKIKKEFRLLEGNVGAGAGMVCHGLKGGIGTASRIIRTKEGDFTLGMLALCNHGMLEELNILGRKPGDKIKERIDQLIKTEDSGSCVMILATDLPLSSRQLKRVVRRSAAGLARCGSYWGHGSGDVAIGFTTAHDNVRDDDRTVINMQVFNEDELNQAFAAAAECAEECVLNALAAAETVKNCYALREFKDILQLSEN